MGTILMSNHPSPASMCQEKDISVKNKIETERMTEVMTKSCHCD